jgi:hypothetical protein
VMVMGGDVIIAGVESRAANYVFPANYFVFVQ